MRALKSSRFLHWHWFCRPQPPRPAGRIRPRAFDAQRLAAARRIPRQGARRSEGRSRHRPISPRSARCSMPASACAVAARDRRHLALPHDQARRHDVRRRLLLVPLPHFAKRGGAPLLRETVRQPAHLRLPLSARRRACVSRRLLGHGREAACLFGQRRFGRCGRHARRPDRPPVAARRRPRAAGTALSGAGIDLRRDRTEALTRAVRAR